MSSIELGCPTGGHGFKVTAGSGSCSGTVGTMCVRGTFKETFSLLRLLALLWAWLKSLFSSQRPPSAAGAGVRIRVRILSGSQAITSAPTDSKCGDVDATPSGDQWCARMVEVPDSSASGGALTVVAWKVDGSGTTDPSCAPAVAVFFGDGSKDCCSGCPSGGGSVVAVVPRELASHEPLALTVPDGPNAGLHRATAVGRLTWEVTIRAVTYRLCGEGYALVIRGPSGSAQSTAVEAGPFSAVFPGAALGSAGDVVVTVA